jgi:hypothetical protein
MIRKRVLLINGVFLIIVGAVQVLFVLLAHFADVGPLVRLHDAMPLGTLPLVEAFGLAALLGIIFVRVSRTEHAAFWNVVAGLAHAMMATCNIMFWPLFEQSEMTTPGLIATIAHLAFVVLEGYCAVSPRFLTGSQDGQDKQPD